MTDIAIQCTTHDNTSGNVHVITVQSIITFICYMYMHIYINCQHTIKALYQMHTHVCYVLKALFNN